jgi:hypothetical protein
MLALILTLLSITPIIAPKTWHISVGAKKDLALFIANLVTKMLWFL